MSALGARRLTGLCLFLVTALALWPTLGRFGAGFISDDGPVLGYVHQHGPWADWLQAEYGAHFVRFWRPLVTLTLDLQEAWTGIAEAPLRIFNWLGHVATALLAFVLARQLGARHLGALLVGALVAWFPYQGGTVVWIVGRVDSQCVPLALGALVAVLAGRALPACALFFLALATKEVAIATLPAALLLVLAQRALRPGFQAPPRARTAIALLLTATATLIWRRLAIGTWVGGYPGGLAASMPGGLDLTVVRNLAVAAWRPLAPLYLAAALLAVVALALPGRDRARLALGAALIVLAGLTALGPLVGNLAAGDLTDYHERTTMFADALLCLVLVVAFVPSAGRALARTGLVVGLALAGLRGVEARADAGEWAAAGNRSRALVADVRTRIDGLVPTPTHEPVLSTQFARTYAGAYLFQWGVADRFRAPFPAANAPVWPWRSLFNPDHVERASVTRVQANLRWPFRTDLRTVPELPVTIVASAEQPNVLLDEVPVTTALLTEPGPLFVCTGAFPGARFEALLFTELGFAVGTWGGPLEGAEVGVLPPGASAVPPFGGVLALRDLLQLEPRGAGSGGPFLYEALRLAADLGATEAYVELRVVDDARGERNRPIAASRWIRLVWEPDLVDALAGH